MENRFENFTVAILKLNKLIQKIKLYEMRDYGLKAIHVMCVYYLRTRGELTASELSKLTLEDKAAISRAISFLNEKGFVNYDSNKYNAPIKLTDEGIKVSEYINRRAESAVNAGGGFLTEEERINFYSALELIAKNLKNYYENLNK